VGYFRAKSRRSVPKSYAEVVRVESIQPSMVYPAASRGGARREGFGVGRDGRGAGRTGRRSMVWQRSEGRRGKDVDEQQEGKEKSVGELRRETEEEDRIREEEKNKREGKIPGQRDSDASAKWERAAEQETRKV
jgi:hypothetical protein